VTKLELARARERWVFKSNIRARSGARATQGYLGFESLSLRFEL
jgi:hypothetical protein